MYFFDFYLQKEVKNFLVYDKTFLSDVWLSGHRRCFTKRPEGGGVLSAWA
jgi:hypothetical protein